MGELERAVMDVLWSRDDSDGWLTVREVHDQLAGTRHAAYTTVMTVMDRLSKKGLVSQEKAGGRAYRYRAVASRGAMTADLMRDALEEFAVGDRRQALVAFVGEASDEERAALREALEALEDR
jgi:predicted transcriptional regulator